MTLTKEENYEFCENFPLYLRLEASFLTKEDESEKFKEKCELIENYYSEIIINSKDICTKFKYISMHLLNSQESEDSVFINGLFYLNFWLNYQLKDVQKSKGTPRQFYDNLREKDHDFDSAHKLNDKIRVIEKEHLCNMIMLRKLYENYNAIEDIIKDTKESEKNCLLYTEESTRVFDEANRNCTPNNINFCRALETFKEKYEYILKDTGYEKCKLNKPLSLTDYEDPLRRGIEPEEDYDLSEGSYAGPEHHGINVHSRNIIVVIFTLISLFLTSLILYKTTPFGIYFRHQVRRVKEKLTNIEYVNEYKSILQNTESQPIEAGTNQLRIPYYYGENT
ncbi:PIR Superfamily Protein [Plasmodium ovale wallikeri]|uniref:PIR Superfamily Protein n=1 Tax=Plasmodium ovale wallikeri TaxID=864142 RepID=A0A1A9ASF1_PLAOA|nr:PIR Superfamily Protein [Plasmodium ovale wallikeri]SBT59086.1 PIR Superfamily Protein [Plasmodium ovale wallikeri]